MWKQRAQLPLPEKRHTVTENGDTFQKIKQVEQKYARQAVLWMVCYFFAVALGVFLMAKGMHPKSIRVISSIVYLVAFAYVMGIFRRQHPKLTGAFILVAIIATVVCFSEFINSSEAVVNYAVADTP
ncbi:hypothetical protein CKALI_11050 [Corynebacterium kalinowskii]|uniref:Uncharacterized protein n=1 Tax=Corynebacterium kalinowskii TaxID=2675216 RepID=A0A6B8VJ45_9CORY|nr:hypothetical protein [Corynebacterium kalinowskii]QGU03059.1 hypothetical protein CKALI_11050 [Corynebacterium kalinowskii]